MGSRGSATLGPSTTAIDVTVYELGCASGESAAGPIAEPEIVYGEAEVVVTIRVVPRVGDRQTCPGNPPAPFTVELAQPLGERRLLDGGQDPLGPPHIDQ